MSDITSDNDDLSVTYEHIIAGIVILLFGLLYWFFNHGWGDHARDSAESNLEVTPTVLVSKKIAVNDSHALVEPVKKGYPLTQTATTVAIASNAPEELPASVNTGESAELNVAGDKNITANLVPDEVAKIQTDANSKTIEPEANLTHTPPETQEPNQQTPPVAEAIDHSLDDKPANPEVAPASETDKSVDTNTDENTGKGTDKSIDIVDTTEEEKIELVPTYSLPDGTKIKIAANGFEGELQQLFQNGELNKPLTYDQIYFDTGSTKINAKSDRQIRVTAALMNAFPKTNILLRGHTDNRGSPSDNFQLSLMRANSMGLALGALGIDTERIRVLGMGDGFPVATNNTEEGRKKNRRIEILLQ